MTESINDSMRGANDAMLDSMQGVIGLINVSTTERRGPKQGADTDSQRGWIAGAIESIIAWTEEVTGSMPASIGAEIASIDTWTDSAAAKQLFNCSYRGDRPVAPT